MKNMNKTRLQPEILRLTVRELVDLMHRTPDEPSLQRFLQVFSDFDAESELIIQLPKKPDRPR